ncbi:putative toxin-antitoxin system toxin component, PIN family [Cognataquiflexum aquatile]|uniref:putative toxin-antitoxin system toxin component, PIN family n=1 Tax=Cognataquiflexum aquatile TaxID=2249427 RepID=UPI000DEA9036|nr:putative toxin-antitoxin system toxin component, PIN family [Cognataquiflexum aquatile]
MKADFRFVVDTNVLVSVILSPSNTSRLAVEKATNHGVLVFSNETIAELFEVLQREKFDKYVLKEKRVKFGERLIAMSSLIPVSSVLKLSRDPKDDMFLNLAVDGHADYLMSGDPDLLVLNPFQNIKIIRPIDFLSEDL